MLDSYAFFFRFCRVTVSSDKFFHDSFSRQTVTFFVVARVSVDCHDRQKRLLTAGVRNAGFHRQIKFIVFNYLCSSGQRSAPKPRTSHARGTLAVTVKTRTVSPDNL